MQFGRLAIFFLGVALLLFATWLFATLKRERGSEDVVTASEINIITANNGTVTVPVEVVATMSARIQGLSDKDFLQEGEGMLFVWNENISSSFVMRRMNFPLDIIFIKGVGNGEGEVLSISNNLPACPGKNIGCATASAPAPFQYVLEVNSGFAKKSGIAAGDMMRFSQELPSS